MEALSLATLCNINCPLLFYFRDMGFNKIKVAKGVNDDAASTNESNFGTFATDNTPLK